MNKTQTSRTVATVVVGLAGLVPAWAGQPLGRLVPVQSHHSPTNNHELGEMWKYQQRAYPLGYIPPEAHSRALQQIQQTKTPLRLRGPLITGGAQWVNIGPAPIVAGQVAPPAPVSGRVPCIAVDPGNNAHWLLGSGLGGVWETTDTGATWIPKTDDQPSLAMGAVAFAPNNTSVIFAGTGEPNASTSFPGMGLLKSSDGGNSWQVVGSNVFARTSFSAIKVNPANSNYVVVGTTPDRSVLLANRGASPTAPPVNGVYLSTDGGNNWTRKLTGPVIALETQPSVFTNQYAAIADVAGGTEGAIYRSFDGGNTWTLLNGPWGNNQVRRIVLAASASNPNTLYACFAQDSKTLLGFWRTDSAWNATPTWATIPTPSRASKTNLAQMNYDLAISVDPANANVVYFGEVALWKYDGTTWATLAGHYDAQINGIKIHPDQHALAWAGNRLLVGNDGGIWSTTDGGTSFLSHNSSLSTIQFYFGSVHPQTRSMALGGEQDNGSARWLGTNGWAFAGYGDGADNAISPNDPDNKWVVSSQFMNIARVTGAGQFFTPVFPYNIPNKPFTCRIAIAPGNENIVLTGSSQLIRTTNFFTAQDVPDWSFDSPDLGEFVSAIAFAPSDAAGNTYAFGGSGGALRVTAPANNSVDIDAGNAVPNRYVTAMAFAPNNANILYATLSGFDEGTPGKPGHVFKTANALVANPTWANVSPPVNLPHNAIVIDPANANNVYVGTDIGVWNSTDGGGTWTHMGPEVGMPNVAVFDLEIQAGTGKVFAFTHGRGALVLDPNAVNNPPIITGFVPTNGPPGTSVTLAGTKFNSASAVKFAGLNAASFTVNSSTQLVATVPNGAVTGPISVTTPAGTATSAANFTVTTEPAITGFSPTSGNAGTVVTIMGANFTGATNVSFNGTTATSFAVNSSIQITATVPTGATTGKISVNTPGGTAQSAGVFTVTTLPVISGFNPTSGAIGSSVVITGANFVSVTSVAFNGVTSASPTVNSPTRITATVPGGATTGPISVTTASGTGQSAANFTVIPAPTITGLSPSSGSAGTTVTITGTSFSDAIAVTFNGLNAGSFNVGSVTQIVAAAPAGVTTGPIRVTTPGGTAVSGSSFTALAAPSNDNFASAQIISGTSGTVSGSNVAATKETGEPDHAGDPGGKSVWYRWTAPSSGTWTFNTVGSSFNTLLAIYTGSSLNTLVLVASNNDIPGTNTSSVSFSASSGTVYQIAVDGALGDAGEGQPNAVAASGTVVLNWNLAANLAPQISSFSPGGGSVGTSVAVAGLNFLGTTGVTFNGASASFTVNSNTQITATVPAGATAGPIQALKPAGTATSASSFIVGTGAANDNFGNAQSIRGNAGTVTGKNNGASKETGEPNHAGNAGGNSVWYVWTAPNSGNYRFDTSGSSFDTLLAVYTGASVGALSLVVSNDDFGGTVASQVSFNAVASTTYDVAVDGYGGATGNLVLNWAFTANLPVISGFIPASGGVGTSVTINGLNFTDPSAVKFSGVGATFVTNSSTQITATVPAGASTGPISVTTTNGAGQSINNFVLTGSPPGNDNFANRIAILGAVKTVTASSLFATREANEPLHAGNAGGHSIWWTWTAPSNGTYAITTRASGFDTLLGVYTGTSLASLLTVASNDDGPSMGTASLVSFTATGGRAYQIAVDGYNGASGAIVLTIYPATLSQDIYYTGFESFEGYSTSLPLAGQNGWTKYGPGQDGVVYDYFYDFSQQAYLGSFSLSNAAATYVWQPLNYTPNTNTRPVVLFSTYMEIVDSTNYLYDDFGWDVYNTNVDELFFLDFYNNDLHIYYLLNDGSDYHDTGQTFQNNYIYYLEVTMDFARNRWSATLDGAPLVQNQPISATNNVALNLGDIDATWLENSGAYGNNYMLFDEYYLTAEPSQAPRIITAPQSQSVTVGSSASFLVVVDSSLPVTYQWRLNGANLAGATGPTLALNNLVLSQAGNYAVVISNAAAVVTSAPPAVLTVSQPPNLAPYKPAGWSDKIVAATNSTGTLDAGIIYSHQDVFVSWAVLNNSPDGNINTRFYFQLYLDGVANQSWYINSLPAGSYTYVSNFNVGKFTSGIHTIRLDADSTGVITESNENDNSYIKTIIVSSTNNTSPQFGSAARAANGQFQFSLSGIPLRSYEIQASSNLATWSVLATLVNSNGNGVLQYSDPTATNLNRRFYRSRLISP